MARKAAQLQTRNYLVIIKVSDTPAPGEDYLTADELGELFEKTSTPAGIATRDIRVEIDLS